jgi:hypothetical protein
MSTEEADNSGDGIPLKNRGSKLFSTFTVIGLPDKEKDNQLKVWFWQSIQKVLD